MKIDLFDPINATVFAPHECARSYSWFSKPHPYLFGARADAETGASAQEQAEDAVRQAVTAWMALYAGPRGQRALTR